MLDPVSMMEDDSSKGVGRRNMATGVGCQVQSFGVHHMQPTLQVTVPDVNTTIISQCNMLQFIIIKNYNVMNNVFIFLVHYLWQSQRKCKAKASLLSSNFLIEMICFLHSKSLGI